MLAGFFHRVLDLFVCPVTEEIHKEIIFPLSFLAGSRFDVCQVDFIFFKYVEHVGQCARLMCGAEKYGGLVLTGRFSIFFADYQKAGDIIGNILDIFANDLQAVDFRGDGRADCGGIIFLGGHLSGLSRLRPPE